jgi:hypothetical protein
LFWPIADFKNDPKSRVLENAYLKYTFNPKLALTVGQFRPWFGIEETYPIDIIKSLDWSNQYTEFGKLGWTSFQIGMSATGQLQLGEIPFQYAVSVVNGNGKTRSMIMTTENNILPVWFSDYLKNTISMSV